MNSKTGTFRSGISAAIPIGLGYLAVSFTFGLKARQLGLSTLAASLMSLSNLTSAGQFIGTSLIAAGAGVIELALALLVVNARYFLMSCSLSQRIDPALPFFTRAVMGFGVTDEIFALSVSHPDPLPPSYHIGAMAVCIPSWTMGTALGAMLGSVLPYSLMNALGIALYGMLIAAIVPNSRDSEPIRLIILVSMLISAAAHWLPLISSVPPGIRIVLLTLVVTSWAALRFPIREGE